MKLPIRFIATMTIPLFGVIIAHAQDIDIARGIYVAKGSAGGPLPSVFRDCWEPLPWYCAKPTGSLWFGSVATLQRHRRAARTVRSAVKALDVGDFALRGSIDR